MRYKLFGSSGLRVSELCLGTMIFGQEWGFGADKTKCLQNPEVRQYIYGETEALIDNHRVNR